MATMYEYVKLLNPNESFVCKMDCCTISVYNTRWYSTFTFLKWSDVIILQCGNYPLFGTLKEQDIKNMLQSNDALQAFNRN